MSSKRNNLVLCLSYQHPNGTAYHARAGDCVYGLSSGYSWNAWPCQTGNFKVQAAYRDTTDTSKCNSWPNNNLWKTFTVSSDTGLNVLLCLSINYPDDLGRAAVRTCLRKSGTDAHPTFTNVGSCAGSNVVVTGRTAAPRNAAFCGRDGSAYWDSPEYPALSYTVCWRWLWNGAGGDRSSGPGRLGRPARNRGTSRVVRCHTIGHETPGNAVVRKDNPSQETSACGAPQTAVQISERARPSGSSATRTTTARGWGQKEKGAG
ncbi:hypothetical protein OG948_34880 (plasmid) [Embleya sp. NBC_00888]|uniref:hypothetical protein n=1 Tax=Embleya sp. NBC_00888 TaxID=2975960 RepID=UPI00386376EE|nr:hypothetical protein OG948_34880 [Embleya sp. NBC_00888]